MEEDVRNKVDDLIDKFDVLDGNVTIVGARYKTVTLNLPEDSPTEYRKLVIHDNGEVEVTPKKGDIKYMIIDDLLE